MKKSEHHRSLVLASRRQKARLLDHVRAIIARHYSRLRPLLVSKTGEISRKTLENDMLVRRVAGIIYGFLPGIFRFALREEAFVQFVLNNRDQALGDLLGPEEFTANAAEETDPPAS